MFPETIEAWDNGPVVPEVLSEHQRKFLIPSYPKGSSDRLRPEQRETIDAVLDAMGHFTAQQLSDMTMSECPWIDAYTMCIGNRSTCEIPLDAMERYFCSLSADVIEKA